MIEIPVDRHFPEELRQKYEFHQWKHACAILKSDFQNEWKDIISLLKVLKLKKTWINEPGGRKTKLANWFDEFLFALRAISVGIIVTRCDELQEIFDALGRGKSYGTSTTHMSKLLPRIEGGGGSGCPILVVGMKKNLYAEDE